MFRQSYGIALIVLSSFCLHLQARAADDLNSDEVAKKIPSLELSQQKSIFIGQNLTPSTDMLRAGDSTVGLVAIAYGITDHWFIATSPWIWTNYNSANLHLKWAEPVTERSRIGAFFSYFDSYSSKPLLNEFGTTSVSNRPGSGNQPPQQVVTTTTFQSLNRYQWQSATAQGLYSYEHESGAITYYSLKYSYYWNDDFPYSIRMDPGSDGIRGQVDATSLTKIPIADSKYSWNLEAGSIGLNYLAPYLHMGSSLSYQSDRWLLQLGASYTVQFRELGNMSAWTPGRYDNRLHYSTTTGEYYYYRYLQTAMHPEVQIQYYF